MRGSPFVLFLFTALIGHRACAQVPPAALAAFESQDYISALALTDNGSGTENDPDILMFRGDCLQKIGENDAALASYDRARILGYTGDDLYLHRGICRVNSAMYEQGRGDLMAFLERHPEDARPYYWLGTIEYMNLENKASVRYLDEAIYLDSTWAEAHFLRAANYVELGKELQAIEEFEAAYRLNPKLHRAKLNVAILLLDMERYRGAVELLSELRLESEELTAEILYYRGEAFFRMHDEEGSCNDWAESAELGDTDAQENFRRLCTDRSGKPRFKRRSFGEF